MANNEKKLSCYIDQLNAGKKPKEHESGMDSQELEELAEAVRLVRSLKEPELPDTDYPKKLAAAVASQRQRKAPVKRARRKWLAGTAAIAAILVLVLILNVMIPLPGSTNVVYAMEQAFSEVKVYRGILELVVMNEEGQETLQSRREVWADKEGRYYVRELGEAHNELITVNNGQRKWQVRPDDKTVTIFPAFPDPYQFTFELGNEIHQVGNALETRVVGEEQAAGRTATVIEVLPRGGLPYRLWVDKETRLPLQKQSAMHNALQYRVTYTEIGFYDSMPEELMAYTLPAGYTETDKYPEMLVNNVQEAEGMAGFVPRLPVGVPDGYRLDSISVVDDMKTVKFNYTSTDQIRVTLLQTRASGEFKPDSMAVLGKIGEKPAEVQSPVSSGTGILAGSGPYSGITDISAIRWQDSGMEYAVVGNASLEDLIAFVDSMSDGLVQIPPEGPEQTQKPQVEVEVDMAVEENEQKSVDNGHTPWRLDPVFSAHVFVNLQISPEGIQGEYPVDYTELKVIANDGTEAIVEVGGDITTISRVYLKRLVRQDSTGIWTVVGYDPAATETGSAGE